MDGTAQQRRAPERRSSTRNVILGMMGPGGTFVPTGTALSATAGSHDMPLMVLQPADDEEAHTPGGNRDRTRSNLDLLRQPMVLAQGTAGLHAQQQAAVAALQQQQQAPASGSMMMPGTPQPGLTGPSTSPLAMPTTHCPTLPSPILPAAALPQMQGMMGMSPGAAAYGAAVSAPFMWNAQLLAAMHQTQHPELAQQLLQHQQHQEAQQMMMAHDQQQMYLSSLLPGLIPPTAAAGIDPAFAGAAGGLFAEEGSSGRLPAVASDSCTSSSRTQKVKALVQCGGTFLRSAAGMAEYTGGETRLITLPALATLLVSPEGAFKALQGQLKTLLGAGVPEETLEGLVMRYELPGSKPPMFIDLSRDDDVVNMWEAWEEQNDAMKAAGKASTKLRICVGQVQSAAAPVASPVEGESDASSVGETAPSSTSTAFAAQQQQQHHKTHAPPTPTPSHVPTAAGQDEAPGSAGAEPQAGGGMQTSNSQAAGRPSQSNLQQLVSTKPRVGLNDLEARLEVLKPEDLKILKFIGAGGYGEVYLCRWSNADVAVKCLNPNLLGPHGMSSDAVVDLMREAMMLGRLRHPNVVWVYGVVLPSSLERVRQQLDGLGDDHQIDVISVSADAAQHSPYVPGMIRPPALVTEYMSGGSVRAALSQQMPAIASRATRVKLALDAARGMEYLHNRKIVHFDLKAANLLLTYRDGDMVCKVADFGLSKQRLQTYVTGVASLRGTLPWTAPEIIRSPHAVNEKVDVFSFGMTMWELWTSKEPWDGLNYHALLHHLSQNMGARPPVPGSPDWEGEDTPEPARGWADMMRACWDDDPNKRPAFSELVPHLKAMYAQATKESVAGSGTMSVN